jgi:hypothetical protein
MQQLALAPHFYQQQTRHWHNVARRPYIQRISTAMPHTLSIVLADSQSSTGAAQIHESMRHGYRARATAIQTALSSPKGY